MRVLLVLIAMGTAGAAGATELRLERERDGFVESMSVSYSDRGATVTRNSNSFCGTGLTAFVGTARAAGANWRKRGQEAARVLLGLRKARSGLKGPLGGVEPHATRTFVDGEEATGFASLENAAQGLVQAACAPDGESRRSGVLLSIGPEAPGGPGALGLRAETWEDGRKTGSRWFPHGNSGCARDSAGEGPGIWSCRIGSKASVTLRAPK